MPPTTDSAAQSVHTSAAQSVHAEHPAFPMPRSCPMRVPEQYAQLRAEAPISKVALQHGRTAWLLTRQEDIREFLVHPQVSTDRLHPGSPLQVRLPVGVPKERLVGMVGMDGPEHIARRRLVLPEFTVKRVQRMRPRVQEIVDTCLTSMLDAGRSADLIEAFAAPVPSMVVCELLGVPYADNAFFLAKTAVILSRNATRAEQEQAYAELLDYLGEVVSDKEREPSDDLIGRLINNLRDSGAYDRDLVLGMARLLLVAGHEATPNMIALGTIGLLEHPHQLAELRADPGLVPQAVEEMLRYFSISDQATFRVALSDIEIGGVTIREGEGVIGLNASANWDGDFYENPEVLDIRRDVGRHLAFGYGPHQCIGQNLVRMNLEVVLSTLFARVPGLRLAVPAAELPLKNDQIVYGVHELPVTW
ncbi:cytochrome P450 [Streptomyces sp. 7N604]|uniref:cytochrome P450 n=1 Tax=Streptomyces sp. 7N604 TaxID=3457415 RepID=UPI003FCFEB31